MVPSNRPRPRSAAVARNSPDGRETGPESVRTASSSKKKPATTSSPRDDARRRREGAAAPRDAANLRMTILCYSHIIAKVLVEELRAEDAESDRFVAF